MRHVVALLLLALAASPESSAQSGNQGSIEGTIADPSGAVVTGVALHLRNVSTSTTFNSTSDSKGYFRFLVLPVGIYELAAESQGFATYIQRDLVLIVGTTINLTVTLKLATQTDVAQVSDEGPILESSRSQISTTVSQRLVASLPVNGRNYLDFVLLTPGVTRSPLRLGLSFAGQRGMTSLLVDGADNNDSFVGTPLATTPSPYQFSDEAVQEFQVNANAYSAEFGRAGSGAVNVVTKSGANELHGSLFWYFRDRALNATDMISRSVGEAKQPFHAHQFGGAVGGPVVHNKIFFFANFDGQRRAEQNPTFLNLPSGFTLSSNATVAGFQRQALDYLKPRVASWRRSFDQNIYLTKIDWHITARHFASARWNRHRFSGGNLEGLTSGNTIGPQMSFERTGELAQHTDTLALSLTSLASPSMVNVARFSHVDSKEVGGSNSSNPEASVFEGGQLVLAIGRAPFSPREIFINQNEWSDALSLSRGSHAIKFGANVLRDGVRFFTTTNFSGSYRFNSLESFGRNLAGVPAPSTGETFIQSFSDESTPGVNVHPNSNDVGFFIQDEWRLRPNLTFNVGLRYDIQVLAQPTVKNPSAALAVVGIDTSFIPTDENNFAPRFGFVWTPFTHGPLLIRGGYGIFFPRTTAGVASRAHYQNGITLQTRTFTGSLIPVYPNTICGATDPSGTSPTCSAPTNGNDIIMPFSHDAIEPVVQQGSVGVEYELQKDLALSLSYLAVKGTHLQRYRDVNLGVSAPTAIGVAQTSTLLTFRRFTGPRPVVGFDRILLFESNANSVYHAMAIQVNKRFSNNFQFLGSYTFSKVIDDNPDPAPLNPGEGDSRLISDSSEPGEDRGPGLTDQPHRFVLSGVWDLNYAKHLPAASRILLEDWQISGIFTAQSGQPYSGRVNFDLNNDGNSATDRTPGLGRNTVYRPAAISLDPRVTRTLRFTERLRLQMIAEAFNVLNRGNISAVLTTQFGRSTSAAVCSGAGTPCLVPQNTGTTAFGTPTATFGPRTMQLSLRLLF
jgi:outer membrane receptor protein involved in Fe transport